MTAYRAPYKHTNHDTCTPRPRASVHAGVVRKTANAVASAGMGGHVLMSSATAARMGMCSMGVLRSLPADLRVYHLGTYTLKGCDDQPLDLVWAQPVSLAEARLAFTTTEYRTQERLELGCLAAPASGPAQNGSLALAGIQLSGLETLMAWDKAVTQQAVQQCMQVRACMHATRHHVQLIVWL